MVITQTFHLPGPGGIVLTLPVEKRRRRTLAHQCQACRHLWALRMVSVADGVLIACRYCGTPRGSHSTGGPPDQPVTQFPSGQARDDHGAGGPDRRSSPGPADAGSAMSRCSALANARLAGVTDLSPPPPTSSASAGAPLPSKASPVTSATPPDTRSVTGRPVSGRSISRLHERNLEEIRR